jgi:glycosyltransferase involved in cell wall biosynthesis
MHICLVGLDCAPYRSSGLAVYGEHVAEALLAAGHRVTMLAALRPGTLPDTSKGELRVVRVPIGPSNWIGYCRRAARRVEALRREEPFDLVHFLDLHFAYAYGGSYSASLLQSFHQRLGAGGGRTYASSLVNLAGRSAYYWLAQALEARSARRARALIALSAATRNEFAARYGLAPERIAVVPESLDSAAWGRRDVAELRYELGLGNAPTLVHISHSTPRKGLEYLAEALRLLPAEVRLVKVGRWERGYREAVRRRAGEAWARVVEVGYVPDAEVPRYLSLGDLFVLPSLLEGFGIPLIEAMACGVPVVASNISSIPEVVGDAGLLVPPRDPQALAAAIRRLLDNPTMRHDLAQRGLQRVRERFERSAVQRRLAEWFEGLHNPRMSANKR